MVGVLEFYHVGFWVLLDFDFVRGFDPKYQIEV